jgi:hypothetical protein
VVKICILNVRVQTAVIGFSFSLVILYRDKICSSIFLQIRIVSIGCKTSRKSQWPVLVEGCDTRNSPNYYGTAIETIVDSCITSYGFKERAQTFSLLMVSAIPKHVTVTKFM